MHKVARKFRLGSEPSDAAFWRRKSPAERLAALESIKCEFHQWRYDAEPRLLRVFRVTRQA
jgi:hypothetical protein